MTPEEVAVLVDLLGEPTAVTYAPPNVYPMSAPAFREAADLDRPPRRGAPVGVYAHVPFCNYKCSFCFYVTRPVPAGDEMARYVAALERELEGVPEGTPLTQAYVGGGTPTALPPDLLDRLLASVFARVRRDPEGEVHTVECSPESLTDAHVEVLRRRGVERVSMGVQTNDPGVLEATRRRHDEGQVRAACERLVSAGFVVNVDLIYGLPGQTEAGFRRDFETVAGHGVHSLTCYNLRVNEHTPIARRLSEAERFDAVRLVRWREVAQAAARDAGFAQTRWHTFRRVRPETAQGAAARFRDVTGWGDQWSVGVSARSRLDDVVYRNSKDPETYVARVEAGRTPVEEVHPLSDAERRLRFVGLTLGDGWPLVRADYEAAFQTAFDDDFGAAISRLAEAGVVADEGERVTLTDKGRLVYDLATRAFYPESVRRRMDERQALAATAPNLRPMR
jgi:oxygen-independent coproporphyrinogen-3 oxidase